jgi:hypothetical protein
VALRSRTRAVLAWALWLVTFGGCAAGLLVTLAIVRPLTVGVLAEGAFTARGEAKSQVAVTHERIPDAPTADKLKAFWRERVGVLKQVLEA